MNIGLLQRLRDAGGVPVPLADLDDDPAALARDLEALEAFGFALKRGPDACVAYRGPAERLCPDQIEWELGTSRIGRRIAVWSRLGSTNDLAALAAVSRANDGLVVMAEEQTAGRGRRGRSWSSAPRSGLLMSVLIFPPESLADVGWLTALGAVAVAELVEQVTGHSARIKWPNDVRVDGRKLAGILVERGRGTVIGLGLNVNTVTDDLPDELRRSATSLQALTGTRHDRSELTRGLLRGLDRHYGLALEAGAVALNTAWQSRLEPLGRFVRLETRAESVSGRLVAADLTAGLTIEDDDGGLRQVAHAEVTSFDAEEPATGAGV